MGATSIGSQEQLLPEQALRFQGSEPLLLAIFRLIGTLSDGVRARLCQPGSALDSVRALVSGLYDAPPKNGLREREHRVYRACEILREIAPLLLKEFVPCRMSFDDLREACDLELKMARASIRAVGLLNSRQFMRGTMLFRAEAMS